MNRAMTKEEFSEIVERRRQETGGSYLDIASSLMEELGIDYDETVTVLSRTLVEKIQAEALKRNLLKEKPTTVTLV